MKSINKSHSKVNPLIGLAPLVLFLSSYIPLFSIIAIRQLILNSDYFIWVGISIESILCFIKYFGMSFICIVIMIFGLFGTYFVFRNLDHNVENGNIVKIIEVSSLNDEPLSYLATYIIPIMYDDYSNIIDCVTIIVIFYIVYRLYIKSKLILVNPLLTLKYSIFSIKYDDGGVIRQGILMSKDNFFEENDIVKIYNVGYQLYYGYNKN